MVLNSGSGGAPSGQALHGPDHQRRLLRPQEAPEAEAAAEEGVVQGHLQRVADAASPRPQGPPRPRRPHGRGQSFTVTTSTGATTTF